MTFAKEVIIESNFNDQSYYEADNLKDLFQTKSSVLPKFWGTRTDLAMDIATKELFTKQGGDRSDAKNVLIMFTDGRPVKTKWDKRPDVPFEDFLRALESKGVSVIVVAVGQEAFQEKSTMSKIAGEPKGVLLLYPNFDDLSGHLDDIVEATCVGKCLDQKMDIAIVGDVSKCIDKRQRSKKTELINELVERRGVSSSGNHFALVTFAKEVVIESDFNDQSYHQENDLKDLVQEKLRVIPKFWGTRTDLAMDLVARELFTKQGGDRPDAKNFIVVFTDGKPFKSKWDNRPDISFEDSLEILKENDLKDLVQEKLRVIPKFWGTRTDLAMDLVARELFTKQGGDRPDAKNFIVVFTDGKPFKSKWDNRPDISFEDSLEILKSKGVRIIVVGVGKDVYKEGKAMSEIAGENGKVLLYPDFDNLSGQLDDILIATC
ncbi:Cartilage matrix protein, partial [Stylophora pistillata]